MELTRPAAIDVAFDYETVAGTATAGDDFVAASGTMVISAGETSGSVPVQIVDDDDEEYSEDFTVVLSDPQGAVLGNSAVVTVTIAANDLLPVTRVTFSVGPVENLIPESESATLSISSGVATIDWYEDPHELFAGQQFVYGDPAQDAYIVSCSSSGNHDVQPRGGGGGALPDATSSRLSR